MNWHLCFSPPQLGLPTELGDEKNCLTMFEKPKELVLDPRPKGITELMIVLPCADEVKQNIKVHVNKKYFFIRFCAGDTTSWHYSSIESPPDNSRTS